MRIRQPEYFVPLIIVDNSMPFKQSIAPLEISKPPSPKLVLKWLWQVKKATSPLVKAHGQEQLNTYFDSIAAAELFVLHHE